MLQDDVLFLRESTRPGFEQLPDPVVIVDLFSGCGGLTLGIAEAARRLGRGLDVALAVDFDQRIADVYSHNFPKAHTRCAPVEAIFDGVVGTRMTQNEEEGIREVGEVDWLLGGPPCQGHSNLNNHTRRIDPRNESYERMARATEVLRPKLVLIENVPSVLNDRGRVVDRARRIMEEAGYAVSDAVLSMHALGVPQKRRRHVLLATRGDLGLYPSVALAAEPHPRRDLRWAIADLEDSAASPLDKPSNASGANRERIQWLMSNGAYDLPNHLRPRCHQGDHSYGSMYGRMRWDRPAQTITTGFGSMGQGRYVHPSRPRTITPHEAARLQFFPDWFDFTAAGSVMTRSAWATMIGNAVPPKLSLELGRFLLPRIDG